MSRGRDSIERRLCEVTGATSARRVERIQSVWSGYGELLRYELLGAEASSVVVKHVRPGNAPTGRDARSHDRKLRSYAVEQMWYERWAERCGPSCRVAGCLHVERVDGEWLFVLEDLDAAGFVCRSERPGWKRLAACLRWLAAFHATFLGERPRGLWQVGTYWHLRTRPDEHAAMKRGPLRAVARTIDERLSGARYLTLVHGDAKPANFCFTKRGADLAAVDFQYVGGGCGMKDVAYLLAGEDRGVVDRGLDAYFEALTERLAEHGCGDADAVESEWRALYPWAWADLQRFLTGWAPGWPFSRHERALTAGVLRELGR